MSPLLLLLLLLCYPFEDANEWWWWLLLLRLLWATIQMEDVLSHPHFVFACPFVRVEKLLSWAQQLEKEIEKKARARARTKRESNGTQQKPKCTHNEHTENYENERKTN